MMRQSATYNAIAIISISTQPPLHSHYNSSTFLKIARQMRPEAEKLSGFFISDIPKSHRQAAHTR